MPRLALPCVAFTWLAACAPEPAPASPDASGPASSPSSASASSPASNEPPGAELIGTPAREFTGITWLDGRPHTLAELRGSVVLVRFWTDTCPYCRRTAPALVRLDADYAARGLVVLGLHHPKPRGSVRTPADVESTARAWGMNFRIGLDRDWSTLDAWWLAGHPREATSASFLIDRRGVIRHVHPGPEYAPTGDPQSVRDYTELRAAIESLLAEPQ